MLARIPLLVGMCLALFSCGRGHELAPERPRLVVLYATCSLNRDTIAPYHPGVDYTPNLARFAGGGAVFTRHQTEVGSSGPSFATLFTGTSGLRHGTYFHPRRLPEDNYLLAEAFADNGYDTFFWSGHVMAGASLGYGQGVSRANTVRMERIGVAEKRTRLTREDPKFLAVLDRLRKDPEYRAYIQINFTMTHDPYPARTSPEERTVFAANHPGRYAGLAEDTIARYEQVYEENRLDLCWNLPGAAKRLGLSHAHVDTLARVLDLCYRASVRELDRHFGAFLDAVRAAGMDEHSLIAFTADHGETLYRKNALFHWTHGKQLSPEVLLVPLLIRGPGLAPARIDAVTRSLDVFPTLAALAGLRLPPGLALDGVDLSPALTGDGGIPELAARSHTSLLNRRELEASASLELRNRLHPGHDPRTMWVLIREGDLVYKLQHVGGGNWVTRVYDWAQDPGETTDLFDPANPGHRDKVYALKQYKRDLVAAYPREDARRSLPDERERLRSLGYIN